MSVPRADSSGAGVAAPHVLFGIRILADDLAGCLLDLATDDRESQAVNVAN